MSNVAVIGSGAWGSALAKIFNAEKIIKARGEAENINADYVFIAVEAQKYREVISKHKFGANAVLIICSKGIEQGSLKLLSAVTEELLPNKYAILSGPNFAEELASGLPAATTIASTWQEVGNNIIRDLARPHFRLYFTDDIIATQIGGAVKNVMAIASGIAIGRNLGENARAAIITRGIAEIGKLASALGGRPETLMGLGGFGDMILTCVSTKSRNTRFGVELAKNGNINNSIAANNGVIEGYYTAKSVYELANSLKIEMPICFLVYEILYNNKDINEAINDLLKRPQG